MTAPTCCSTCPIPSGRQCRYCSHCPLGVCPNRPRIETSVPVGREAEP